MTQNYIKRFLTKDGNKRVTIYFDEDAENPRYNTDEPLHCEDWSRDYSIMNKQERESKSSNACELLKYLLGKYGNDKKIIEKLVTKGRHLYDKKFPCVDALKYNKSTKCWELWSFMYHYNPNPLTRNNEYDWMMTLDIQCKRDELDLYYIIDNLDDESVEYLAKHCMTDKVKIASYSFGYNGEVSFSDSFDVSSDGICWLEKDEFMKYSGCSEVYWKYKTLTEIEWLISELKAWGDGDVYGFVTEEKVLSKIHKEYTNVERDDEDYEKEEWEETDSCWGFYGELDDEHIGYILESAGLKKDELDEA